MKARLVARRGDIESELKPAGLALPKPLSAGPLNWPGIKDTPPVDA